MPAWGKNTGGSVSVFLVEIELRVANDGGSKWPHPSCHPEEAIKATGAGVQGFQGAECHISF